MKQIHLLFLLLTTILSLMGIVSCKDKVITAEKLPATAKSFIEEHFPGNPVSFVKKEAKLAGATYETILKDGTEIEFDAKGEWDKVDCKRQAVPSGLVPAAIAEYIQSNFSGQFIVMIDKEPFGTEIELDNDLELKYDKQGRLMNIDD